MLSQPLTMDIVIELFFGWVYIDWGRKWDNKHLPAPLKIKVISD